MSSFVSAALALMPSPSVAFISKGSAPIPIDPALLAAPVPPFLPSVGLSASSEPADDAEEAHLRALEVDAVLSKTLEYR